MNIPTELVLFLTKLPNEPGVYRMLDEAGNLLYVGKASNLKNELQAILINKIRVLKRVL